MLGCWRSSVSVTGKCTWAQTRAGHSWISGHPHSILYKAAGGGMSSGLGVYPNTVTSSSGSSSSISGSSYSGAYSNHSSLSHFLAYNLARFSTFSVAFTSSATSSPNSSSSQIHETSSKPCSSPSQQDVSSVPISDTHESNSAALATRSHTATNSAATKGARTNRVDKDDDWAVNESYSGHGHGFVNSNSSTSETPTSISNNNDSKGDLSPQSILQPSPSPIKDSASIEASWRRTSESLPSLKTAGSPHLFSQSKAGGLDLSSSTLVQQMLFKDRPLHADETTGSDCKHQEQGATAKATSATTISDSVQLTPSLTSMMESQTPAKVEKSKAKPNDTSQSTQTGAAEDPVSKLDIRVGIVRSVTQHPDAESLYIEQVDVGDMDDEKKNKPRTIVSGLVRHVPKDYLEGRAVIVVGNMKPSKLRGVMSEGMLLCAVEQKGDGPVTKVALLEPADGSQPGDKVTLEGYTDADTTPAPVLTPKRKWFEKSRENFSVQDGVAYYRGSPFKTVQGLVRCRTISKGQIS
ncbi:hypothetical protein BG004_001149 [Podila humilis]|nr:hypothetical protein BG004_001149 [Podila humilis]